MSMTVCPSTSSRTPSSAPTVKVTIPVRGNVDLRGRAVVAVRCASPVKFTAPKITAIKHRDFEATVRRLCERCGER